MKRAGFLFSLFACLVAIAPVFGQSDAKPKEKKTCPFNIVGMWKSEATTETNPVFYLFRPNGWVRLMEQSADALPEEFEVVAEVRYKLNKPNAPKLIEFITPRGNDAFQQGVTMLDITEHSENSFTTVDPSSAKKMRWERMQTHRYFLTFAARSGSLPYSGSAFVMFTTMDGRNTGIEAIGIHTTKGEAGKTAPDFGLIPAALYEEFRWESDKDEDVMMRLELSQTEYERTRRIFEVWAKQVKEKKLPYADPYLNAMELISKMAESLNECSEKIKLPPKPGEVAGNQSLQPPLAYIKAMRKQNDERHLMNAGFPTGWRPMLLPER